mgnify:CR=1 FL=1
MPNSEEVSEILASHGLDGSDPFARFSEDSDEGKFLAKRKNKLRTGTEALWKLREDNAKIFKDRADEAGEMPDTLGLNLKYLPLVHTQ